MWRTTPGKAGENVDITTPATLASRLPGFVHIEEFRRPRDIVKSQALSHKLSTSFVPASLPAIRLSWPF